MFEFPITKIQGTEPFTPAPFIAANINQQAFSPGKEGQGSNPSVMYDATNRQFVEIKHGSYYPSVMDFSGDKQLFQNPTGRDMVFMAPSRHGPIYAVLRDPSTKETYFYGFMMHGNGKSNADSEGWNVQVCHGKINGPGVEDATLFAFHPLHNYIFYAVGGSIYRFNWLMPDTPATEVINLSGEEISVLKFNSFRGPFPDTQMLHTGSIHATTVSWSAQMPQLSRKRNAETSVSTMCPTSCSPFHCTKSIMNSERSSTSYTKNV